MDKTESYYLRIGTEIVDDLYDKGYFCKELKREDMRNLDDLFGYYIQTHAKSAAKASELTRRIRERKEATE